jgi:ATP synthase protein I
MSDNSTPQGNEDFDSRLRRARGEEIGSAGGGGKGLAGGGLGLACRVGTELIAALAVGVGIGLLLDKWLATEPWFFIAFIVIGGLGGVLNVFRLMNSYGYSAGYRKTGQTEGIATRRKMAEKE